MAMSFVKRLQGTPKMRSIKKKIREQKAKAKSLSNEYKRVVKSEGRRLGRIVSKQAKRRKAVKRKKRR